MKHILLVLSIVLIGLLGVGCSCATVEPGQVGIGVDMDGVQDSVYQPGFHVVSITTSIVPMSLQTQTYEMAGDDEIHALTQDQLSVDLEVTINFSLNEQHAIAVYTAYTQDYAGRIVHPIVRTAVRDAASTFTAPNLVDHRDEFQAAMEQQVAQQLTRTLQQRQLPPDAIRIENVMLRNIDLPEALDQSIAAVQQQRMQTQQRQQALQTAEAEAARLRTEAEGAAAAQQIRARAEAEANRTIAESLTSAVLEARRIEAMQALANSPGSRVVFYPAGTTPQIRVDTTGQ